MLRQFNSNNKKLNKVAAKVNINNLINSDLTGSLLNIEIPNTTRFQSKTKTNPNPVKLVNNKTTISNFHQEILQNSARYISRQVDAFDNSKNTLTILNDSLDYGTEGASPNNFEILVYGLHIPGDYTIKEINIDFSRDINGNPDKIPVTTKIGMNLGFLKRKYQGATSYVSETLVEPATVRYLYLAIDDFNNNVNNHFISAFNQSILSPNILARISVKGSYFSLMMETDLLTSTEPRKYFGPVDIQKLHVQVYDDHGRILDTNNSNFSCCILFKMLYDL